MKAVPRDSAERAAEGALRVIRIPFFQRALFTISGRTEHLFLVDLGLRGVFAERENALPIGEPVTLTFALPGNEIPLTFLCRVAWWHAPGAPLVSKALPAGIGLEFVEWSEADHGRLRRYLEGYLQREPAGRRFHRPLPLAEDGEEP
jgi:Tfp pilus assembly protein PilZ